MANTIKLKRASGSDPGNSDLAVGELAIRTSNCKLFSKNDGGSAVGVIAGSADTLTTARNIAGVSFDGSANISLNNNAITNGAGYIADLVSDTSPQLGGDLDMNSQSISSGILNIKNTGSQSEVRLYCEVSNAHYISLKAPAHSTYSGNLTYTLPPTVTNGYFLQTNGSGVLSWAAVNTDLVNDTSPQLGGDLASNSNDILMADDDVIKVGTGSDLQIDHDSSSGQNIIQASAITRFRTTSLFSFQNSDGSEEILKGTPDGSVQLYHNGSEKLQTTSGGIDVTGNITVSGTVDGIDIASLNSTVSGKLSNVVEDTSPQLGGDLASNGNNMNFADNDKAYFGSSNDLMIEHNGSNSIIKDGGTGALLVQASQFAVQNAAGTETMMSMSEDGSVDLYFNDSKTAETVSGGFSVTGTLSTTGNISVPDDIKALFGTGNDIEIYHTSGHSYIQNNTGGLRIEADTLRLRSLTGTENYITADVDGSVALYHDNSKKAETASDGLEVTGTLTCEDIDCSAADLNVRNTANNKVAAVLQPAAGQFFYHNNTLKLNTASTGITVAGRVDCDGADLGDSETILLGNSDEFQIFYDGNHARLDYLGSGSLQNKIAASSYFQVVNRDTGDNMIQGQAGGNLEFYHAGSKKAETVSGGFTITGTCTATAFSGDGSALTNLPSSGLPLSGGELTGDLTTHVVKPDGNGTRSLGTSSLRWSDVFTSDLHLSNEGSSNKVDNSWGDFTIQEGMEDLFLINNRNGKMYKFLLKEVG